MTNAKVSLTEAEVDLLHAIFGLIVTADELNILSHPYVNGYLKDIPVADRRAVMLRIQSKLTTAMVRRSKVGARTQRLPARVNTDSAEHQAFVRKLKRIDG